MTANFKGNAARPDATGLCRWTSGRRVPERVLSRARRHRRPESGTAFSLLPAENATGNYIKVVQRVPVKIVFDQKPDIQLGPGMSVVFDGQGQVNSENTGGWDAEPFGRRRSQLG